MDADEIFISEGSKSDCGYILDILGARNKIAISDPVYPVYVDTNVMVGRTGAANKSGRYEGLVYLPCTPANNFVAEPPSEPVDIIYLCFPNNPTGATYSIEARRALVDLADRHNFPLLADEVYADLAFDGPVSALAALNPDAPVMGGYKQNKFK